MTIYSKPIVISLALLLLCANAAAQTGDATPLPPSPATLMPVHQETPIPFALPVLEPGTPITLAEALQMADRRNLTLEATRTELEAAEADLYKAWGGLLPTANASMTYTHLDHEDTSSFFNPSTAQMETVVTREQDTLTGGIDVSVPIVNPRLWKSIDVASDAKEVTQVSISSARQALLMTVARAYFQALSAMSLIDTGMQQMRSSARHLEIAKTYLVTGMGKRLDVIRAQSDIQMINDQLIGAHAAFENSRDVLANLTGSTQRLTPVDNPGQAPLPGTEDELIKRALENREDIRLKRALVELADSQLGLSWMQFLPSLNFSWQLTHKFDESPATSDADTTRWAAYLMLQVPIYSQPRYADLDKGRAALRKSQLEEEDALQAASLSIRTSRRNYLTAVEYAETASQMQTLANEALNLTEEEYRLGTGSSLAVTDARRSANEAAIRLAVKRFDAQMALLELLRATGEDVSALP